MTEENDDTTRCYLAGNWPVGNVQSSTSARQTHEMMHHNDGSLKDRSLEIKSVFHECAPGRRKIAVKVVDIFGNDTMTIVDVSVGKNGGKK